MIELPTPMLGHRLSWSGQDTKTGGVRFELLGSSHYRRGRAKPGKAKAGTSFEVSVCDRFNLQGGFPLTQPNIDWRLRQAKFCRGLARSFCWGLLLPPSLLKCLSSYCALRSRCYGTVGPGALGLRSCSILSAFGLRFFFRFFRRAFGAEPSFAKRNERRERERWEDAGNKKWQETVRF